MLFNCPPKSEIISLYTKHVFQEGSFFKKNYCNYLSILTNKFSTLVTLVTNIYFGAGHFLCKLFYLKLNGHCGLMAHYAVQFCSLLVDVDLKRILFSLGQSTAALCDCRLICTLPYMALFISSAWALT